ncbi:hypothetical protein QYF61_025664 [Mycteria americana]|uniref:Uncharacterized protein n=1 Tax=Mycteria americana TaxID=33587 RepID=A0AAN7NY76_MYCAM|nr:hypothetical protein QYF61_025664 [Mycteria americana]
MRNFSHESAKAQEQVAQGLTKSLPQVFQNLTALDPAQPALTVITACERKKGWRLNHFPGQPVPMLDNPFSKEIVPNIQSKPPLVQLEAISSCPITCYLGEETDPHLSTTSFQAKQPQFPQLLLIRLVLQTLHQLRCPSLDTLQHLNVLLVVRGPKPNTAFELATCMAALACDLICCSFISHREHLRGFVYCPHASTSLLYLHWPKPTALPMLHLCGPPQRDIKEQQALVN